MSFEIDTLHTTQAAQSPSPARLAAVKASERLAAILTPDQKKTFSGMTVNNVRKDL